MPGDGHTSRADFGPDAQRVFDGVGDEIAAMLRRHMVEPLASPETLAEKTRAYGKALESMASDGDVIDLELVGDLMARCERLLEASDEGMSEEHRRLVQSAVLYFIEDDDAESDTESLTGFDDDGAVIEAVAIAIGRPELLEAN